MQRRIHVVLVTTRAAASSLPPGNGQVRKAVHRGIEMLDGMADEIERDSAPETQERLNQAKRELASLLDEGRA